MLRPASSVSGPFRWPGALVALLLLGCAASCQRPDDLQSLEHDIARLEQEIAPLPRIRLNPSPHTLGYRSHFSHDEHDRVTIELSFARPADLDLLAFVPATYSPDSLEVTPLGFPKRFHIELAAPGKDYQTVVDYRDEDYAVTGIEPQLFPLAQPVFADRLRLSCTRMGDDPSWWDGEYVTALSEILAFAGPWNAALGARVEASTDKDYGSIWSRRYLTDGFCLFSPVDGQLRHPFLDFYFNGSRLELLFDLGRSRTLDEIRLWPAVHSLQFNFPQASGVGFPSRFRLERLHAPGDRKGETVLRTATPLTAPGSSPHLQRFPSVAGRYFRLTLLDPVPEFRIQRPPRIILSEVQLLSQGQVVSGEETSSLAITSNAGRPHPHLQRLTDGLSTEGKILPLRQWIEGLATRAAKERRLANLRQILHLRREQRQELFRDALILLLILLPLLLAFAKLLADRKWKRVRDRIACDLHDEIGANASGLVHLTELLAESLPTPTPNQKVLLAEALETARLTSAETRDFVGLLETNSPAFNLRKQIALLCSRLLTGLDHYCEIAPQARLSRLPPARQWDLFLFIKESLNNIRKHARATRASVAIKRHQGHLHLHISDNGRGAPADSRPPRHLEIRAKRLGGTLTVTTAPGDGFHLHLILK
ncbi:sensor histidine kinase [Roseibacillus ishigakijimensis]|uniref:Histidine kinase n=1 Tax=Roseibacillus ishigakijimensis TaxID=454146 RepID=A0A934RPU8_9BACT|nr:histidine kinase [Roseibacillus ishigakijimensis]MBK1833278.1 hypothetical protein [Roseibacillus ishigakijimensis]